MKTKTTELIKFYLLVALMALTGCKAGSTFISGNGDKMNGGFEIIRNGLPVNWHYYTRETVLNGDFDIVSDTARAAEGRRSLKFTVRRCESTGGRLSPGFFEDFKAVPGETYKVSFRVINKGCRFRVYLESSTMGNSGPHKVVLATQDTIPEWRYFEYDFATSPTLDMIRFEANILSPGTIWFDDVRIEGVKDKSERVLWPARR